MRQTTYPKGKLQQRSWYIVDAKDCICGRLASRISSVLMGKEKNKVYTPYADNASGVIVINAEKIKFSSAAKLKKPLYWHTGYAGGIKSKTVEERFNSKNPEQVLYKAIERMIPRSPLGRKKMKNLRLVCGENHSYNGLKPSVWNLSEENKKNSLSEE